MAFTNDDKRAIDAAAERLHYLEKGEDGMKHIELYADYRDTNESLLQIAYDNRHENDLMDKLRDQIADWYFWTAGETENEILSDFDPDILEEAQDYFRENYAIDIPYDHFLDQSMKVNLMLDCGNEANRDFISIYELRQALIGNLDPQDTKLALEDENGLSWLVKQQGYTMSQLQKTMQEYDEFFYGDNADHQASYDKRYEAFTQKHSRFLSSVCQELDNAPNYMNTLTILAEVSAYDFARMMQDDNEIVFPKNVMLGIYSPWQGGGSVLEIELEKDLVVPTSLIWDAQIEGAQSVSQYTVDSTYGLVASCWKNPLEIREASAQNKTIPSLESMIQAASQKASAQNPQKEKTSERDRF